jgi:AhpD family alkylhydroperoxidase
MEQSTAQQATPRIEIAHLARDSYRAMAGFERSLHELPIEPSLLELIKLRASTLNGCAFCIDMHAKDARAGGETDERIWGVAAWREAPFYTAKERAALRLCDALTHMDPTSDAVEDAYAEADEHFEDSEIAAVIMVIAAINSWNRIAVGAGTVAGLYQPAQRG